MSGPNLADKASLDAGLSTAVTGETGSGKTTFLKMIAYQMPVSDGTAVVAHDLDEDYQNLFGELGLEPLCLRKRGSDARWNLFLDVDYEDEYRDIAMAMLGSPDDDDDGGFFHGSAVQILEAVMKKLHRDGQEQGEQPTHADIKGLTLDLTRKELHDTLEDDFPAVASIIEGDSGQSQSVHSTLIKNLNLVLTGDFAKPGTLSLRDYLTEPDGRVLIVDSDVDQTDSLGPMFRLILNMSIKYAMTETEAETNFILDEIDELPRISMLSSLASKGRSRDARCLIGIQTVDQLRGSYGKDAGVLGNCPQEIHFAPGDAATIQHVRKAVGKRMTTEISHSTSTNEHGTTVSSSESRRERNPISPGALNDFETGDAVVINQSSWWMAHVADFATVRDRIPGGVSGYTNAEMMAHLAEHSDGDPPEGAGSTGAATGAATSAEDGDDGGKSLIRTFRNMIGFPKHNTGLTPAGREFYGEDDSDD